MEVAVDLGYLVGGYILNKEKTSGIASINIKHKVPTFLNFDLNLSENSVRSKQKNKPKSNANKNNIRHLYYSFLASVYYLFLQFDLIIQYIYP